MEDFSPEQVEERSIRKCLRLLTDPNRSVRVPALAGIQGFNREKVREIWEEVRHSEIPEGYERDPLFRTDVEGSLIKLGNCVAVVFSQNVQEQVESMLSTLVRYGNLGNFTCVLLSIEGARISPKIEKMLPDFIYLDVKPRYFIDSSVKSATYAISSVLTFEKLVVLETDLQIVGDLSIIWDLVGKFPSKILGAAPWGEEERISVRRVLAESGRPPGDVDWIFGEKTERKCLTNGGFLAGDFEAWKKLKEEILSMQPFASIFLEGFTMSFGDEFIMNLALGTSGFESLPVSWNVQFYSERRENFIKTVRSKDGVSYYYGKEKAKVLHFPGTGRPLLKTFAREIRKGVL